MKVGIDISQIAFKGTGVSEYVKQLIKNLLKIDKQNEYILFGASLRRKREFNEYFNTVLYLSRRVTLRVLPIPPVLLNILWNWLHILPIEWFIGNIDVFISSDWTQPPTLKAKKATILYDLIVYKYPKETAEKIVATQKRRLSWVKRECDVIFCISEATKMDAMEILGIEEKKLKVIYPGI